MADRDIIQEIEALVARLNTEYADDPNVSVVGWGLATRKGELKDGVALVFHVRKKLSSERGIVAAGSRPIPAEIEGYATDVVESNLSPAQAGSRDETKFDPLRGGPMTSNSENHIYWFNGAGTLGVLVRDNATLLPHALSNWHVWADGGSVGDQIIQPGHPTTGDHIEGITKVLACGPLLTSLIEWEAPSPLAVALYGGAAAAAIAAAASDYRDPTRRGQDHTATGPGELTLRETVDVAIEYPELPLPGVPFRSAVKWEYARETDQRVLTHAVGEDRVNTQFLLGKVVYTDRSTYQPGDAVRLTAAIWDYQPRPCDGYHVVAHLIPHNRPDEALRVVMSPSACPRTLPPHSPGGDGDDRDTSLCVVFDDHPEGEYPYKGAFQWLSYLGPGVASVWLRDWLGGTGALVIPHNGLEVSHPPAVRVTAKVAQFTDQPVTLVAYGAGGTVVGQATAPAVQGTVRELSVSGGGITGARFRGGGGEGLLVEYCIEPVENEEITQPLLEAVAAGIALEIPDFAREARVVDDLVLKATRCCFTGTVRLPPGESPGKWDVHLTVQNVNTVPAGTDPEEAAAAQIGGHVLSSHTAQVVGCVAIMLMDHVFDVI